jgi:tyrosyl-tRNA synthetase
MEKVGELAEYNKRCFEGLGLKNVKYVLGSDLQLNRDYELLVLQLSQQITLNRATRSMDEVGRQMDHPTVSQMVYPIMQMADIAMLGVDAAVGGIDQRKIHMLAREHLINFGYKAPVCIHTPILNGLDGKKMSSSQGNYISVADTEEEILKKCQKAFCPPEIPENPVLQIFQYHIFPRLPTITIKRPEKFGGDRTFSDYKDLEVSYGKGEVHPLDLKKSCGLSLVEILEPVRDYIG